MTWRLTGRRAFRRLRHVGQRGRSGPVTVIAAPSDAARARVAFAVGKALGPAVARNRVRRRLRHALSQLEAAGRLPAADYLVIASPGLQSMDWLALVHHTEAAIAAANSKLGAT
ncbi:MAG: ribonuclease P protein component [Microthrixaceae bacterium]